MIHITATVYAGSTIDDCIKQAIQTCGMVYLSPDNELPGDQFVHGLTSRDFRDFELDGEREDNSVGQVEMTFSFNDVQVTVKADSDPELIRRDWMRALYGKIDKTVGPYPNPVLTDEETARDAEIDAERERKYQEWQAEQNAKAAAHRERVEARMADAPAMEFSDKAEWNRALPQIAESLYGSSISTYAERWARLMQLEMSEGKTLEDIWDSTSLEADLEGMTGYSQGWATHLLTETWAHGAELRALHNARWGSDSTVSTVNPALVTLRGPLD